MSEPMMNGEGIWSIDDLPCDPPESVNGWDHVNSAAVAKDAQTVVDATSEVAGKADLTHTPASVQGLIGSCRVTGQMPPSQLETPKVSDPVVIAGFTRIASDDDFKAWLKENGPIDYSQTETRPVPLHFPFWVKPTREENAYCEHSNGAIVLSKEDVQSLMNCTNQAISLYRHWVVERRTWALDESGEG